MGGNENFKRNKREGNKMTKLPMPRQPRVDRVGHTWTEGSCPRVAHVAHTWATMVGHLTNLALTHTLRVLRPFSGLRIPISNPSSDYES